MPAAPGRTPTQLMPRCFLPASFLIALFLIVSALLVPASARAGTGDRAMVRPATVIAAFDRARVRTIVAEGLADRRTGRAVTADSPVRVASVSKLVTALGVLRLVDRGVLDLDRDVSVYLGWQLRHPAFPDQAITLRMLLSHTSGMVDGEELYLIPLGETLRERLADPRVWDHAHPPGSGWFHYANINFPVVASVMEAATGNRFDAVMRKEVLGPLRLDACFNWSGCSPAALRRAVVLYRASGEVARDDLRGRLPDCLVLTREGAVCDLYGYVPGSNGALFSPQGGLRISMRDLARLGQMLGRGGRGFLSPASFAELTRAQWRWTGPESGGVDEGGAADGLFCAYGLGTHLIGHTAPFCRDDLFADGTARIGHPGAAYGLRSGLWLDPASGRGAVWFSTALAPDGPPGHRSAFSLAEETLADRAKIGQSRRPQTYPAER